MNEIERNILPYREDIYTGEPSQILAKGLTIIAAGQPLHLFRDEVDEIIGIILACLYLGIDLHPVILATARALANPSMIDVERVFNHDWGHDPAKHLWTRSGELCRPLLEREPDWSFATGPRRIHAKLEAEV